MRKPVLFIAVLAFVWSGIQAQTDYMQWLVISLKPKLSEISQFEAGLTAHNKKFHTADPYKAFVFEVNTGPGSGSYMWVMGPITFTQTEARPTVAEHDADWNNNVIAHCESVGEVGYWRLDKDNSYMAENGSNFTHSRMRWSSTYPGEGDRFGDQMKKVAEVYKQKKYNANFNVYWHYGATAGPNVVTEMNFEKLSFLDEDINFRKDFESVHGDGSWSDFLEEIKLSVDREKTYDEMINLRTDMSSGN